MTENEALALAGTEWWKHATDQEIVGFQLFEDRLCMPFGEFHGAVERVLGRSVWTHEFATSGVGRLKDEFEGKAPPRTIQEILDLIPPEKRIVVTAPSDTPREREHGS